MQNLLSVKELADKLNVPKSWIYSRTRETGQEAMPRIKVGKYCRFVLAESSQDLLVSEILDALKFYLSHDPFGFSFCDMESKKE